MTVPPGRAPAPQLPLDAATMERWGIHYDRDRDILQLAPRVLREERVIHCAPFRVGRTVVMLECRLRPSSVVLRLEVTFGPPIRVETMLPGYPAETVTMVDDVPVSGPWVAFEARAAHEVAWLCA